MKINSHSVKETLKIGKVIAKYLKQGDIVCLFGTLGAGKTILTKGIASGLGIAPEKIISPTFVLIRQHHTKDKIPLYHFDLYRLKDYMDILSLGHEEYFYTDGIAIIEWPQRLKELMPDDYLEVKITVKGESERSIELNGKGVNYKKMAGKIYEDLSD